MAHYSIVLGEEKAFLESVRVCLFLLQIAKTN